MSELSSLNRAGVAASAVQRYATVRAHTAALCEPLAVEDYGVQPFVDASPPKWHLAHTTWFFETFLLKAFVPGYRPFHPAFEHLFNSYYNGVGEPFPRPRRGALSRPTVAEVLAYRHHVDEAMQPLLSAEDAAIRSRIELGLHHEQQHQELIVTDIKANLGGNPLRPAYAADAPVPEAAPVALAFNTFNGGKGAIGHVEGAGFSFDNELPRHGVWLRQFAIANRLTTNGEYLAFMEDGGYEQPGLWLSDGWAWRCQQDVAAPLYWQRKEDGWWEYQLDGEAPIRAEAPVAHVSYFEADAYARWAGCRLPTEAEWETAAANAPAAGGQPARHNGDALPGGGPDGAHRDPAPQAQLTQMFACCWQWTASAYAPYPGYRPLAGALGEYNGKFMSGQQVLRGSSCATPPGHARATYRNFFYPKDRWQFTGIRLAR